MPRTTKRLFRHRLVLEDRGEGHIHRYRPSCPCGWVGLSSRRPEAEHEYRQHRLQVEEAYRRTRNGLSTWSPLTHFDELPEGFR